MNSEDKKYLADIDRRADQYANNDDLKANANAFFVDSVKNEYSYNFTWLGRPIVQYPQDIIAMQEIICSFYHEVTSIRGVILCV